MKNRCGQALVEFIIVLPVLMFLIMGVVDFGNIIYEKYRLENEIDYIADLYLQGKENDILSYAVRKKMTVHYHQTEEMVTIDLEKRVSIVTPGLSQILENPYFVKVSRVIYDEE